MYAEPTSCASFVGNFNIEEIQNQYLCTLPFPDITTEIPSPRNRTWQENDVWENKWSMLWRCTFTFYQILYGLVGERTRAINIQNFKSLSKQLRTGAWIITFWRKDHNNLFFLSLFFSPVSPISSALLVCPVSVLSLLIIRPESDHCLPLSLTDWLTH